MNILKMESGIERQEAIMQMGGIAPQRCDRGTVNNFRLIGDISAPEQSDVTWTIMYLVLDGQTMHE